jgi:hypothetical protein
MISLSNIIIVILDEQTSIDDQEYIMNLSREKSEKILLIIHYFDNVINIPDLTYMIKVTKLF